MPRTILALAFSCVALAYSLASGARTAETASGSRLAVEPTGQITLQARFHNGPWKKSLSLKLVKLHLINFFVCGIWNRPAAARFDCAAAADRELPVGTTLRLEQNPVARAARRADSPGWGMLGASPNAALGAVLSNTLSGNRLGTVHYRVTLRDRSSQILAKSNTFTLVWHR